MDDREFVLGALAVMLTSNSYENYHQGKESSELDNIETWTENGWTKVHRVIRHKLNKNKK